MDFNFSGEIPDKVNIKKNAERGEALRTRNDFSIALGKESSLAVFYYLVKTNGLMDYKTQDQKAVKNGTTSRYEDFGNYNYGVVAKSIGIERNFTLACGGAYHATEIMLRALKDPNFKLPLRYAPYLDDVEKLQGKSDKITKISIFRYFINESMKLGKETGDYGWFDDPKDQEFIKQGYDEAEKLGYGNKFDPIKYEDMKLWNGIGSLLLSQKEIDNTEEIINKLVDNSSKKLVVEEINENNKENIIVETNSTQLHQGQATVATLISENIPKKAQAEFLKQEDLKESEKNLFSKVFDNVSDKVKTLTEKKLDLNNLMQGVKSNAMDAILNSAFIKALLAMFGVKEERFKELFQGLFDKVGGFDKAMNNSFGFGINASSSQQIDFSNFIWKGDTAGCRQFCDGEMSLNQRGYNRLLGMVQQGKMSQEMFNYCCNRNPIRQDMNEFYADMKAGLGEGVANIMMQMAKAESGLGKNIMNKEAAGAAGELQLIRSNAIAFGKKVWGAGHSDVEILKRYDEDPKFRNQVAIEFCKEQLKALKPPTAEGIRAVWFLGVGGGPKFLRAYHSNPNMSVANIFDDQVMKQNGMNANWTLKDCYDKFIAKAGFGNSQRLDINIPSQNYANNNYSEEQSMGFRS